MIIQINDDWRVRSAYSQWVLERKTKPRPKKGGGMTEGGKWREEGYFLNTNEIWPVLAKKQIVAMAEGDESELPFAVLTKLDRALKTILDEIKAAIAKGTQ